MKKTVHCSLSPVHTQEGSALLITLLIVTILVSLTVEFAYEVYVNTSALSNWTNAQKASLIAKSGQTLGAGHLKDIGKLYITHAVINLPVDKDFGPNTKLTIKIEDEHSKFNINSITKINIHRETPFLSSLQKLFEYLNINPSLALTIADYIDTDQEPRPGLIYSENGAKNSELWSIEELKLIPGIDKKTFDTISPYLTVYSSDTLDDTININTAKLPVLFSLSNEMTETLAQKIIDYREITPFENMGQVWNVLGKDTMIFWVGITYKISLFRINSSAIVNEITRVIESVMDTSMNIQSWREG